MAERDEYLILASEEKMYKQKCTTGKVFVISGPSGVGKKTIIDEILRNKTLNMIMSISMTTRHMREGEVDGKDYYFRTRKYFEKEIENDAFLEYSEFVGNYYGTPKKYIYDAIGRGQNVLLEIDVVGYKNIRNNFDHGGIVSIFIAPPTLDVLRIRLMNRNTESHDDLIDRLAKAELEMEMRYAYDFVVVNDKVDDAVRDVEAIIMNHIMP